jgi:adenylosuccinate lyase
VRWVIIASPVAVGEELMVGLERIARQVLRPPGVQERVQVLWVSGAVGGPMEELFHLQPAVD